MYTLETWIYQERESGVQSGDVKYEPINLSHNLDYLPGNHPSFSINFSVNIKQKQPSRTTGEAPEAEANNYVSALPNRRDVKTTSALRYFPKHV